MQERSLYDEEQNYRSGINAKFHGDERGRGLNIDTVRPAEFGCAVDDEFLNQVSAVGDAGDERRAGNRNSTERKPRTNRANEKRRHADSDERELPDAGSDGEVFGFAQI